MDEDVAVRVPDPIDEPITLYAIEPFDLHRFERPGVVRKRLAIGPVDRRHGRPYGARQDVAEVDRQDFARLQATVLALGDAIDQGAFRQAAAAMIAKHGKVDEDVAV